MKNIVGGIGAVGIVAAGAMALVAGSYAQAKPESLFQKDAVYGFVWDCLPQGVARNSCYSEALLVKEVREDGWLRVIDPEDGSEWFVNPARALGVQRAPEKESRRAAQ